MSSSNTAIVNSAFAKLGADRIISLDDDSKHARLAQEQYGKVLEDLLRAHPWNFAIVRTSLAATTTTPAYEYSYEFQLPSDCLRVLETDLDDAPWRKEGSTIVTETSGPLGVLYVTNAVEAGEFDANFSEAFASKLAHDLCYAITGDLGLKELLWKEYKSKLSEARSFDAQESGSRTVYARQWLNARY